MLFNLRQKKLPIPKMTAQIFYINHVVIWPYGYIWSA